MKTIYLNGHFSDAQSISRDKTLSEKGRWSKFNLGTPADYIITVSGHLEEAWSKQLGMTVTYAVTVENDPITILTGQLIDQAALFGVLNGLYNFGFPLLHVQCISMTVHSPSIHS